jgi:hypothetical protein
MILLHSKRLLNILSPFTCQCQNYDNPFIEKLKSNIMFVAYCYGYTVQFINLQPSESCCKRETANYRWQLSPYINYHKDTPNFASQQLSPDAPAPPSQATRRGQNSNCRRRVKTASWRRLATATTSATRRSVPHRPSHANPHANEQISDGAAGLARPESQSTLSSSAGQVVIAY